MGCLLAAQSFQIRYVSSYMIVGPGIGSNMRREEKRRVKANEEIGSWWYSTALRRRIWLGRVGLLGLLPSYWNNKISASSFEFKRGSWAVIRNHSAGNSHQNWTFYLSIHLSRKESAFLRSSSSIQTILCKKPHMVSFLNRYIPQLYWIYRVSCFIELKKIKIRSRFLHFHKINLNFPAGVSWKL